ncbi:MAG TPA: NAD-dependent succinate-semialdehyde dehydrogenase [Chitinophagales bacterium]|nr:NAD-dependent succinate-semialdehyde dehydrogenase [Chitinophagales bacterium]
MRIATINPFDNKVVKKFRELRDQEVDECIRNAVLEFEAWKNMPVASRSRYLKSVAEILQAEKKHYASIITLEMGKPVRQAIAEIEKCALVCEFYSETAAQWLNDEKIQTDASNSYVVYEPLGVVLGIMPWNFPFWQVFRFAVPAIAAGNVVLLKHALNVPQCALAIQEIFRKAQPGNIFQSLLISQRTARRIIAHPAVKMVSLTGSDRAGSEVAALAGQHIKKSVMELGGSDPFIVLDDANLKSAAEIGVRSRMQNAGQSCIAAKRFIVRPEVYDQFVAMLAELIGKIKVGNPADEATDMGPLAREDLARSVMRQVNLSVKKGAKIVAGGNRPSMKGAFVNPTLLTDVKPGMPAFDEEVFGPVASVVLAKDDDDAVHLANKTVYGLGASIWSEDIERATRLSRLLHCGSVFINGMVKSDPRLPFGGVNRSGYGRELSIHGLREFVNVKAVWVG